MDAVYKEHKERFSQLKKGGEVFPFSLDQYMTPEAFVSGLDKAKKLSFQVFAGRVKLFSPCELIISSPRPSEII